MTIYTYMYAYFRSMVNNRNENIQNENTINLNTLELPVIPNNKIKSDII